MSGMVESKEWKSKDYKHNRIQKNEWETDDASSRMGATRILRNPPLLSKIPKIPILRNSAIYGMATEKEWKYTDHKK